MNIHEHQAKQILKKYGAPIPKGVFALSVDELLQKAKTLKTKKIGIINITMGIANIVILLTLLICTR